VDHPGVRGAGGFGKPGADMPNIVIEIALLAV